METIKTIYYLSGILFALNFFSYIRKTKETLTLYTEEVEKRKIEGCILILYYLWLIIGLTSFQWIYYFILLLFATIISSNQKHIFFSIKMFIISAATLFIIINGLHLKITL